MCGSGRQRSFGRNILELLVLLVCLSVLVAFKQDNEGRYFLHYYMRFGPLLFEFYHMYSNLRREEKKS